MRAVIAQNNQPTLVDIPTPSPGPGEVLIRVKATALNRADLMQVQGNYPPPPGAPETLGLELAGEVAELGEGVTQFTIGQPVMALVGGGGYAEYCLSAAETVMPAPKAMTLTEAAAIPEAFLTAYSNMVDIGGLKDNECLLIHAGASGVGLAATQIAKVIGAQVIVTASAGKHAICKEAGADLTIDYKNENFAERILAEGHGVDLILDMVGAPYWDDNLRVINTWGRIVYVGLQGGATKEINLGAIMQKRLSVMGSTLRNRTPDRKAVLVADFTSFAMPHFASRSLKPNIWRVMPFDAVQEAHDLMRQNANAGKIVLEI